MTAEFFEVPAEAYGRFMGRFSTPLAQRFLDFIDPNPGDAALDVGCGPGVFTAALADRVGAGGVAGIDPSASFVAAARARVPGADIRLGAAETLPWPDASFSVAAAQLVVHLMADTPAGVAEMARVVRPGGTVAATVWDFAGDGAPISAFWQAARELDPAVDDESGYPGAREGDLERLFAGAGLEAVESAVLTIEVPVASFDEWWHPFTLGVGPAGAYLRALDDGRRDELRAACARRLPVGEFTVSARAWAAAGSA